MQPSHRLGRQDAARNRREEIAEAYAPQGTRKATGSGRLDLSNHGRGRRAFDTSALSDATSAAASTPQKKSRGQPAQGSAAHSVPPRYLSSYLDAMENTMTGVWGPLGFFDMSEGDFYLFLKVLRRYYKRTFANPSDTSQAEELGTEDDALLVRNALWVAVSNAVFYCLTVLDPRRLRAQPPHPAELEVRTGGVEDQYEVVYGTPPDVGADAGEVAGGAAGRAGTTYYASPFVPVPLRWRRGEDDGAGHANERSTQPDEDGSLERLHARLTELPIADWYLALRCLAQIGYRRDVFYTQSPSQGSPHELMLALLWLTRKYELVAVVEYIDLDAHYGFLLRYHSNGHGDRKKYNDDKVALLEDVGQADPWPPRNFKEPEAIASRLAQIDGILGCTSTGSSVDTGSNGSSEKSSVAVRRLAALQRLVALSLNRLQHALEQRAEQASTLGLHSALDVQLCQRENHDAYTQVMEGLHHVSLMPARVQGRLDSVSDCGLLIAQALRRTPPLIRPDEVVEGLKEDESTWLKGNDGEEGEGDPEDLASVMGRFRAAHTKQYLADRWKSLVRQERAAPAGSAGDGREGGPSRPRGLPFALDGNAQYREECRVHNNVITRYSLEAALAAEVLVLQVQERRKQEGQMGTEDGARSRHTSAGPSALESVATSAPAVTTVALVPLMLKTTAGGAGAGRAMGSKGVQATEVGPPAPGATTSARVETARLQALLKELESFGEPQRQARVANCQRMLKQLYQVYDMRLALGCLPTKAKRAQ